jgi:cytochrome b561
VQNTVAGSRGFSASVAETASAFEQQYAAPLRYLHWLIAGGTIGAFASVQYAMQVKGEDKATPMMLHKSLGLSVLMLTAPRLALRLTTKIPPAVPGSFIEQTAATAGHALMYVFLVGMPATGWVMGYFGGKGFPFFGATIPGAEKSNGKLAGRAFKLHKQMGYYYQLFVPLHVGAVGVHALKGQHIMRRMGVTAFG